VETVKPVEIKNPADSVKPLKESVQPLKESVKPPKESVKPFKESVKPVAKPRPPVCSQVYTYSSSESEKEEEEEEEEEETIANNLARTSEDVQKQKADLKSQLESAHLQLTEAMERDNENRIVAALSRLQDFPPIPAEFLMVPNYD
jgi:hypothetical protein